MSMLPRLKPRTYYDLVIQISIVRLDRLPAAWSILLRRRNGEEDVVFPHACLEPVLHKTLGVPLFRNR